MELFIESPCIVLEKLKIQIKDFYLIKDSFPKRIRQKKKILASFSFIQTLEVKWSVINNHT